MIKTNFSKSKTVLLVVTGHLFVQLVHQCSDLHISLLDLLLVFIIGRLWIILSYLLQRPTTREFKRTYVCEVGWWSETALIYNELLTSTIVRLPLWIVACLVQVWLGPVLLHTQPMFEKVAVAIWLFQRRLYFVWRISDSYEGIYLGKRSFRVHDKVVYLLFLSSFQLLYRSYLAFEHIVLVFTV